MGFRYVEGDTPPRSTRLLGRLLVRILSYLVIIVAIAAIAFGGGVATMWLHGSEVRQTVARVAPQLLPPVPNTSREEKAGQLLEQVWGILDKEYLDPQQLQEQKMIWGAAEGLVNAVGEPHTLFVEPVQAQILEEDMQGSFEGIGANVDMINGKVTVIKPLPNSPALKVGLKPGDIILAVNDEPLEGKTLSEAIHLIRGPRGTVVKLRIQRQGTAEPFVLSVTRDKVESPTVEYKMLDGNIGYVRLIEFNAISQDKVHEALAALMRDKPVGLIFDLRGNPGGFLQSAVEIASEFLPRGTLVLKERERDQPLKEYRVEQAGVATTVPLVVLVDGGSASAAEIVAGSLRDNQRAVLIGQKSYGKGSVQSTHTLLDGSSLRVTIAKWDLPSGVNLDGNGLVPAVEVPYTKEDEAAGKDPQLDRAITYLQKGN